MFSEEAELRRNRKNSKTFLPELVSFSGLELGVALYEGMSVPIWSLE